MPAKDSEYRNFSLPIGLVGLIERTLAELKENGLDIGYGSTAEFVKEAVRYRIEELRRIYYLGAREARSPQDHPRAR